MIVIGDTKSKKLFIDGHRVYKVFIGEQLVYNCYAIPEQATIYVNDKGDNSYQQIHSNTEWQQVITI